MSEERQVDPQHLRLLEALIFASADPVPEKAMADRLPDDADIPALVSALRALYEGRGVELRKVGAAWAFRTADDLGPMLNVERTVSRKPTRAALETLAIVAYHQPVTRAEIEEIRGVSLSKGTIDNLFEAGWIKPKGRRRTPGRPVTWGTTEGFLDQFGLENLDDLPGLEELKAAGLLDKRAAIVSIEGAGKAGLEDAEDGDVFDDDEPLTAEPLDPDDGEEPLGASPD